MKYTALTKEEWEEFLSKPFNPPPSHMSDDEFEDEFRGVEKRLNELLSQFGENGVYPGNPDECDYYLDNNSGRTRGLGFAVMFESAIENAHVLQEIRNFVDTLAVDYDIVLEGEGYSYFIYVNKSGILTYKCDREILDAYGLKKQI